jgi:replication factor C subunit 1
MDIRSFFGGNPPAASKKQTAAADSSPTANTLGQDAFFAEAAPSKPDTPPAAPETPLTVEAAAASSGLVKTGTSPPVDVQKKRKEALPMPAGTNAKKQKTAGENEPSGNGAMAEAPLQKKRKFQAAGGASQAASPVSQTGAKSFPSGPQDCLERLTFVITGVLESFERDAMVDFIKQHGGRVTGSVSSRTTHLLAGLRLEDGRPVEASKKYKTAKSLPSCKIVNEDEVIALVSAAASAPAEAVAPKPAVAAKKKKKLSKMVVSVASAAKRSKSSTSTVNMLWADKYKPQVLDDLVGNGTNIRNLLHWLKKWSTWHRKKVEKAPYGKGNPGAKAALLSGPPGIGKSSTAAIIGKHLGYEVYEMNASDTRSKKGLEARLNQVTQSSSLSWGGGKKPKRLIVMDEVDGMSSGDRGGMAELIKVIKTSKTPIICICNDRQSTKVRSLANNAFDLRFQRPNKTSVAKRMLRIAEMEGLDVAPNAMEALVEQTGNDIRQVLNSLQMWRQEVKVKGDGRVAVSYNDMKNRMGTVSKDASLRLNPFDCAGNILCPRQASLNDRINMFFVDYDLMPLLIQQNYLSSVANCNRDPKFVNLRRMADAASAVSDADLAMTCVRKNQRWDMLTKAAALNVRVGAISQAPVTGYCGFPEWMGHNSRRNKRRRILQQMSMHMGHRASANASAVRLDYFGFLRDHVMSPLVHHGKDGVQESIAAMEEYGLTREDVFDTMKEIHLPLPGKSNATTAYDRLKPQTKAAFTRAFNKTAKVTPEMLHALSKIGDQQNLLVKKKSSRGGGGGSGDASMMKRTAKKRAAIKKKKRK